MLIGVVVFPAAEIANVPRAADVGRPRLRCILNRVVNPNWEEYRAILAVLAFPRRRDLALDPAAPHGCVGQNDHDLIGEPNRFLDTLLEAIADFQILRSKPT